MTSTDRILDQIDAALGDGSVGPDAMRCGPAPEDEPRARLAAQVDRALQQIAGAAETVAVPTGVWIAPAGTAPDDDTEWEPLHGVTLSADIPDVPTTPTESDRDAARLLLIRRLVANHGLDSFEAGDAVDEAARGLDGPYTHLARAEAQAVIDEAMEPLWESLNAMAAAMRPAMENVAGGMRRLAAAARAVGFSSPSDFALAPPQPSRPADRPAWQSPYGPAARRRP